MGATRRHGTARNGGENGEEERQFGSGTKFGKPIGFGTQKKDAVAGDHHITHTQPRETGTRSGGTELQELRQPPRESLTADEQEHDEEHGAQGARHSAAECGGAAVTRA